MGNKLILVGPVTITMLTALFAVVGGCWAPDTREPRGALAVAAEAIESDQPRRLFRVIDQRSRHALAAIQQARAEAAGLIRTDYPTTTQTEALTALGDAALATDAPDLFERRCTAACQAELGALLGAPVQERTVEGDAGPELEVETATGSRVRLYKGNDGHYGIVFRRAELFEERDRAARELEQIRQNAEVYRKRKTLEAAQAP
jgi:hypothetical protein